MRELAEALVDDGQRFGDHVTFEGIHYLVKLADVGICSCLRVRKEILGHLRGGQEHATTTNFDPLFFDATDPLASETFADQV